MLTNKLPFLREQATSFKAVPQFLLCHSVTSYSDIYTSKRQLVLGVLVHTYYKENDDLMSY